MSWTYYLLQVNIYLVIFYAFFKLLLDKETYFTLNRIYLVTAGILSLTIPFIRLDWFARQPAAHQVRLTVDQLDMMMAKVTVVPDQAEHFNWGGLIAGIYLAGIIFFAIRFILQLLTVQRLIKDKPAGMAFSFFSKIVIDYSLPGADIINQHEKVHIRQFHTIDILFFELLGIINWCNPIIYFYKTTIKNIHEYLADEAAAGFDGDKKSYAMLLLSKTFGVGENVLTNSFFNKSLIKKRIFMLHKQRSKKTAILKYGLFLPLFAVALLLSSATISKNEKIKAVAAEISVPFSLPHAAGPEIFNKSSAGDVAQNWSAFYTHLAKSIRYPLTARTNKLQGNTVIKFIVKNGEINEINVNTALGSGCDKEVMSSVMDFDGFKAIKNGQYSLKVAFRLEGTDAPLENAVVSTPVGYTSLKEVVVSGYVLTNKSAASAKQDIKVYDFVSASLPPMFPGGMNSFHEYLKENLVYPAAAKKNNIQGNVFLSFIVEKSGELTDIKVERKLGSGTDEEAVRLLKDSPKWTPGYIDNHVPVRVKYNIPITFSLDSNPNP